MAGTDRKKIPTPQKCQTAITASKNKNSDPNPKIPGSVLNNNVNSSYEYTFTEFIEDIGCYLPLRYKGAYVKKIIFTNQLAKRNT